MLVASQIAPASRPGGVATPSLVAHTIAGSTTSSVTTPGINTSGASLLVAVVGVGGPGTISVSDSAGNTWLQAVNGTAPEWGCSIFYVDSPTTGTSQTCTAGFTSSDLAVDFLAYSNASALDKTNTNSTTNFTTSRQPGSITPTQNGELLICGLCIDTNESYSIDSGFSILDTIHTGQNLCVATLVQATTAAINPTWSFGSARAGATIASFEAAAGLASVAGDAVVSQAVGRSSVI